MSQQAINQVYDTDDRSDEQRAAGVSAKPKIGELVVGVRIDALPQSEAERLAGEGRFHPLTLDADGNLRVTMPDGISVKSEELEVLREIRNLLVESRDLLLKIA